MYNSKLQLKEDQGNETGLIIYADRDRLEQVLTNLLDNAIKFSDSGTIVVSISKSQPGKEVFNDRQEIIVSVKDVGKGIDPEFHSKVFLKSFSTFDSGGIGLGLFICKAIVEAHGGNIWVENNVDQHGVTFSFSLPLVST